MARRKETDKLTIRNTESISIYDFGTSLKSLAEYIERLREKYGDDASLEFDYSRGYYDSVELEVELTWERLETDDEVAKRVEKNRKSRETAKKTRADEKERKAAQELADLEKLIKKHPKLAKKHLVGDG